MPVQTPWRQYVTPKEGVFSFTLDGGRLAQVRTPFAVAHVNHEQSRFRVETANGTSVPAPFWLRLQPWRSPKPPIIALHPLAITHLLLTGEVDRRELIEHLARTEGTSSTYLLLRIATQCKLLASLILHPLAVSGFLLPKNAPCGAFDGISWRND